MAVIVRHLTTCYKCEKPIMAEEKIVHPLCEQCEMGFDHWFKKQLEMFK